MYLYLILNIAVFALSFLFESGMFESTFGTRKQLRHACYLICCAVLLLASALRHGIAVDYNLYYERYISGYKNGNQLTVFVWLFRLLHFLHIPYQVVIALCSAGFLLPVFWLLQRHTPRYQFFGLGVLLGFMFYIQSFNIFRQYLAMGLLLAFLARYLRSRKWTDLSLCLIPVLIHPMLGLSLPVYILALLWKPDRMQLRVLQVAAVAVFVLVSYSMTEALLRWVAEKVLLLIPAYAHYVTSPNPEFMESIYRQSMELIPKVLFLPCIILIPEMILFRQKKLDKKRLYPENRRWWMPVEQDVPCYFLKVYFLYMLIMSFKLGSEIVSRFLLFYSVLGIFVVPMMFSGFFRLFALPVFRHPWFRWAKEQRGLLLRLFQLGVAAVCIYTQIRCIGQNATGAYPYQSIFSLLFS